MPGHRACARDFAPAAITDRGGRAKYRLVEPGVAECRDQAGAAIAKAGAPGSICEFALRMKMLDLFYIVLTLLFFVGCWFLTKACDKL